MVAKTSVDKWKKKKRFQLQAPALFNNVKIGETFADDQSKLVGRRLVVGLSDLRGAPSRQNKVNVLLKVTGVKGENAETILLGHVVAQDYERSLVRRRTSKIYVNRKVVTKDKRFVNVKSFIVTARQINKSRKKGIAAQLCSVIEAEAAKRTLNQFMTDVMSNRLFSNIRELSKVYPIKRAVIQKTEILFPKVEKKLEKTE